MKFTLTPVAVAAIIAAVTTTKAAPVTPSDLKQRTQFDDVPTLKSPERRADGQKDTELVARMPTFWGLLGKSKKKIGADPNSVLAQWEDIPPEQLETTLAEARSILNRKPEHGTHQVWHLATNGEETRAPETERALAMYKYRHDRNGDAEFRWTKPDPRDGVVVNPCQPLKHTPAARQLSAAAQLPMSPHVSAHMAK